MKQRILAGLVAVALVVAAVVARSAIAGDGSSGGGRRGGDRPVIACTPDLEPVCEALVAEGAIVAGTASLDLDGAAAPDAALDGWITWDPAPGIANIDADRSGADKPWGVSRPLGGSSLAVAIRASGGPPFPDGCTQVRFGLTCLTQAAGANRPVGVGTGRTAESLARLHPIALTLLPDPTLGFDQIPAAELRELIASPTDPAQQPFPDQLRTLRTRPGALDFLVGPAGAMDVAGVVVIRPQPRGEVVIVLAVRADGDEDLLQDAFDSEQVEQALRAAGVDPGSGTLAPEDRAGDLYAVRDKVG